MNVLMAGVGGQGILFVTRLLADMAVQRGWSVAACETHGMAQRGGSVVSHLKLNQRPAAPLIRQGRADLLLGLNEEEGLRHVGHLRKGGSLLLEKGRGKFTGPAMSRYLRSMEIRVGVVPAVSAALEMGYPLGANLVVLGAASAAGWLPFSPKEMERALGKLSKRALLEKNLQSLRLGMEMGRKGLAPQWAPG